jgi:TRAP-type transport system periplasmic protein
MFAKNTLHKSIFIVITVILLTACVPQASKQGLSAPAVQPTQAQPAAVQSTQAQSAVTQPITLQLATYDDTTSVSAPYINEFAHQVNTLSGGNITIMTSWTADTEQNVLKAVIAGKYDLGLVASRAWDTASITSFQALQAPFLINNDALAIAVATSDTARQMLDNISSVGLVGLTLWPEDLRHPFSVVPGKPLLSPTDFPGLVFRVPPSGVSNMLILQLGGNPISGDSGYQAAESGLTQLGTLNGRPIATGNVTFYPKYQVLFANGAAFNKLSTAQQKILSVAAAAAQKKAIAEHQSDEAAGTAWCADGSTIVLASDAQIAAFQQAAQPVFDTLNKDSFNAKMIAVISTLKANTPASPEAQACGQQVAQISPQPTAAATEAWSTGTLPNGVWTVTLSADLLFQLGASQTDANDYGNTTYRLTFQDGKFINFMGGGQCQGTYAADGNVVRLTYTQLTPSQDQCTGEVDDIQWRLDSQGLMHFQLVDAQNAQFGPWKLVWEAEPWQPVK